MIISFIIATAVDTLTLTSRSPSMEIGRQMVEMQVVALRRSGRCGTVEVLDGKLTHEKGGYVWTYRVTCSTP